MALMGGPHLAPSLHDSSPSAVEVNFLRHSKPWTDVSMFSTKQTNLQQQVHLTTTSIHNTTSKVMTTTMTTMMRSFGGQEGLRGSLENSRTVSATAMFMFALLSSAKHPVDEMTNKLAGVASTSSTVKLFQTPFLKSIAPEKLESISQSSKSTPKHPILHEQATSTRRGTHHVTTSPHLESSLLPSKEIQHSIERMTEHGTRKMTVTMSSTESNPTVPIREGEGEDSHDLNESLNFGLIFGNSSSSSTLYELEQANFDKSERLNESIAALNLDGVETTQEDRNDFDLNFFKSIIAAGSSDGFVEGELQNNYYNDTFSSGYEDLGQNQMAANDNSSSSDYNETLREQISSTHKPQVYVLVGVSVATVVLCLLAVFGLVVICRRHVILSKYNSLPSTSHSYFAYDYIYRPLHGNRLDDEYENTFVGVSIPLLQEVTVI